MAITKVDTAKLRAVAGNLAEIDGQYNMAVEAIYNLGGEIDNMWDGDASDKFKQVLGDDQTRFKAMSDILKKYVEGLSNIATKYEEAERRALETATTRKA